MERRREERNRKKREKRSECEMRKAKSEKPINAKLEHGYPVVEDGGLAEDCSCNLPVPSPHSNRTVLTPLSPTVLYISSYHGAPPINPFHYYLTYYTFSYFSYHIIHTCPLAFLLTSIPPPSQAISNCTPPLQPVSTSRSRRCN